MVTLTNSQGSNLYQNCSLVNFNLEWDRLIIGLKVPGKKTKSLWLSRTSQLVRKIRSQNQSIIHGKLSHALTFEKDITLIDIKSMKVGYSFSQHTCAFHSHWYIISMNAHRLWCHHRHASHSYQLHESRVFICTTRVTFTLTCATFSLTLYFTNVSLSYYTW